MHVLSLCTPDDRTRPPLAASVLWEFDRYLGEQLAAGELTKAEARVLEQARERLRRLVNEHNRAEFAA